MECKQAKGRKCIMNKFNDSDYLKKIAYDMNSVVSMSKFTLFTIVEAAIF
jgi:hypothetical protein